jgi:tRNA dimethylallyltransferase
MTCPTPEKPKIIVICGPTGVGKTSVGIDLARVFDGEIISADSMQIYRYMDIGTAKPTGEELASAPHHMINIVDPDEDFDAAQFSDRARPLIPKIQNRRKLPVVVGGTGFYIKSLLYGIFKSRAIDPEIRSRLRKDAKEKGSGFMYDRLKQIDPATAKRLHPNDSYRVIRALETIESTGRSILEHHQNHGFRDNPFDGLKIGLQMDRQMLYRRIDRRVDSMIEAGLEDEVKKLFDMGYSANLKSMQSIGYRHMADFVERRLSRDECIRTLKRDTRRFAKRQFTWFGADKEIIWLRPDQSKRIHKLVNEFAGKNSNAK